MDDARSHIEVKNAGKILDGERCVIRYLDAVKESAGVRDGSLHSSKK